MILFFLVFKFLYALLAVTIVASGVKPKFHMNPYFGYNKYKITRYNPPLIAPVAPPPLSYGAPPPPPSYRAPPPPPSYEAPFPPPSYGAPPPPSSYGAPPPLASPPVYARAMDHLPDIFNSRMGNLNHQTK